MRTSILQKLTGAPTSWHIMGALLAITALAFAAHSFGRRTAQAA